MGKCFGTAAQRQKLRRGSGMSSLADPDLPDNPDKPGPDLSGGSKCNSPLSANNNERGGSALAGL